MSVRERLYGWWSLSVKLDGPVYFWAEVSVNGSYDEGDVPEDAYTELTWNATAESLREWADSYPAGTRFRAVAVTNEEKENK